MNTIIVSAVVGLLATLVTAIVTARLNARAEAEKAKRQSEADKQKFNDQTMLLYAQARAKEPDVALSLAQNQAVAVLRLLDPDVPNPSALRTLFLPENVRITVGWAETNDLVLEDRSGSLSRCHCAFRYYNDECWLELFGTNGATIAGQFKHRGIYKLQNNEAIQLGPHTITFHRLKDGSGTVAQHPPAKWFTRPAVRLRNSS
jgi:hypothetical protein